MAAYTSSQCNTYTLFALPVRMGGLRITIPSKQVDLEHQLSQLVTSVLQDHILMQDERGLSIDQA